MRIVIITDALTAPLYTLRVRFLNHQLKAEGHQVVWFTEACEAIPAELKPDNLVEIPFYNHSWQKLKGIMSMLFDYKNRFFAHRIRPDFRPDLVFCSTFMTFGLRAGIRLKQKYGCKLAFDFRDIAEQTPANSYSRNSLHNSRLYRQINIRRRNQALRRADCVTTVSQFHASVLKSINPATHIIYNGYDKELFRPAPNHEHDTIRIVYLGKWYGPDMQDPRPIFRAIAGTDNVTLTFHTDPGCHAQLAKSAQEEHAERNIVLQGYVPYSEVPRLLNDADFALVLTSSHNHGVLTTKFFEALGCHTPVILAPSDCGELAQIISKTHAGLASSDPEELRHFILSRSQEEPKDAEQFSRQHQTERLINLLCSPS